MLIKYKEILYALNATSYMELKDLWLSIQN
jgi:hypothetical protein